MRVSAFVIGFTWIGLIYLRSLGTYGWHYDEPFYGAEALDFYKQLIPVDSERPLSVNAFTAITIMVKRLPDLSMTRWGFDSGLPLARALMGSPLLLFKFDPLWSRIPYAIITILALFYLSRYMYLMAQFFSEEEGFSPHSRLTQNVGLIATVLFIAVSPTCFFQAHFVIPQTISFLLLAMACYAMARGFIDQRANQTIRAMGLFVVAIVLNYQNLLLVPFILFNLLFFGLAYGRKVEAGSAFVVLCALLATFVAFCRDFLVSAFGINVTGAHSSSIESVPLGDRIGGLCERLSIIVRLVGVPAVVCVTGCLLAVGFGLARIGPTTVRRRLRFSIYAAGTMMAASTVPVLFLVSSNESSAVKYLIDVLLVVSPLFLIAVTTIVALLTAPMSVKRVSPVRVLFNTALVIVGLSVMISQLARDCVSRFAWNFDYEAIMKEWIPVVYAGRPRGLVFGSDWYQHTFAFTGGDGTLSRDFAYVPPGQLPDQPQGTYSGIRLVKNPSKDYWTDPALNVSQFDYARFVRERDSRLNALRPFVLSGTLVALGVFVALNSLACINVRWRGTRVGGRTGREPQAKN